MWALNGNQENCKYYLKFQRTENVILYLCELFVFADFHLLSSCLCL